MSDTWYEAVRGEPQFSEPINVDTAQFASLYPLFCAYVGWGLILSIKEQLSDFLEEAGGIGGAQQYILHTCKWTLSVDLEKFFREYFEY